MDTQQLRQAGFSEDEISQHIKTQGGTPQVSSEINPPPMALPQPSSPIQTPTPEPLTETEKPIVGKTMREMVPTEGTITKAPPSWIKYPKIGLEMLGLGVAGPVGYATAKQVGKIGEKQIFGTEPPPSINPPEPEKVKGQENLAMSREVARMIGKPLTPEEESKILNRTPSYITPKWLQPILEKGQEVTKDIGEGIGLEVGGNIAGKVISKAITPIKQLIRAPFGKAMTSPESQELARIYKEFNIPASPSDLIPGSKTLAIAEGVLGYRPISGDVMLRNALKKVEALNVAREKLINQKAPSDTIEVVGNRIRKEAEALLERYTNAKGQKLANMVDEFTSKLGISGRYDAGKRFTETMVGARQTKHDLAESLFNKEKEMLPRKGDDIIPFSVETTDLAKKLMKEELSKLPPLQDSKILGILKSAGGGEPKLPEGVTAWEVARDPQLRKMIESTTKPELTWNGMKNTRSDLLERVREIHRTMGEPTKESRMYTALEKAFDKDMSTFAEKQGGDIWKTHLSANKEWREMHEVFDKDILKIMRSNPEDILNRVVNKGEITLLKQVRQAAGEDALIPLRQGFFKQTLDSSTSNGVLNPTKLGNSLKRMGTETLSELATPQELAMLNNIVKSGQFFSEKQAGMKTVEFLETLSKTDASKIVDTIIKPNNTYTVKIAKKLLSPERLEEIQSSALEKILKVSGTGNYLPISSAKTWVQYNAPMKELLPKQTYDAVTDFLKSGQNMSRVEALAKNASQTGQVLLGSQIGGAVIGRPLSAAKLLLVPWALAKIYVSPTAQAYLTKALRVNPASPEAISLFIKAATIAGINLMPSQETKSPRKPITTFERE